MAGPDSPGAAAIAGGCRTGAREEASRRGRGLPMRPDGAGAGGGRFRPHRSGRKGIVCQ